MGGGGSAGDIGGRRLIAALVYPKTYTRLPENVYARPQTGVKSKYIGYKAPK